MEEARCYVKSKDLDEAKRAFAGLVKKMEKTTSKTFNFRKQFDIIVALCKIVDKVYVINDFQASCMAYMYTLPRIVDLLEYISLAVTVEPKTRKRKKKAKQIKEQQEPNFDIQKWMMEVGDNTIEEQNDGTKKEYVRIKYLYNILKIRQMAIAARYFIDWNIQYLEKDLEDPKYPKRRRILKSAVWWCNQMLLNRFNLKMPDCGTEFDVNPTEIIFSTFPSSGKSFLCNTVNQMFSELSSIITKRGGMLRVGNEQSNICNQSSQTKLMIENPLIFDIYPENKAFVSVKTGKYDPFDKSSDEEWRIKGCNVIPNLSIFKTRESRMNSVRCEFGIFDDPSGGTEEAANDKIHEDICNKFYGDFSSRFDNPSKKAIILTGTMYNPNDIFSREIQRAFKYGAVKDNRFENTFLSKDKSMVVIVNDCENDRGESAYPEFISTKALMEIKDTMTDFAYHCVYRQKPIPAESRIFAKDFLRFYDELPGDLSRYSFAVIDPTRKRASDFFAMPIFRMQESTGDYYLVDIIFAKRSSEELLDSIVGKILSNYVIKLRFEENINGSLGARIRTKLEQQGVDFCDIQAIYSKVNKQQRISNAEHTIKRKIVFPSSYAASSQTPMGYAIYQFMQYTGEERREHDDMADAVAMFASEFIMYPVQKNTIKSKPYLPY